MNKKLLKAKGIYNPLKGQYDPDALILEGEKITGVGPFDELREGHPEAEIEDRGSLYLLPGLINTHVHLEFEAEPCLNGPDTLSSYYADIPEINFLRAANNAAVMLRSGVTTLRDAGSSRRLLSLKKAEQFFPLPRLVLAGPPLTVTGGHLHFFGGEADTEAELIKAVRERRKWGCESIKLIASGGQLTPGSFPEKESYSADLIALAAGEAHRLGMTTFAHCLTNLSMVNALRGGVRSIEHGACFVRNAGNGLLERVFKPELLEEFRGCGRYFMKGVSNNYHALDRARENPVDASPRERFLLEQEDRECRIFHNYTELGLIPVIGTDAGCGKTPFDETWLECRILHERCGMSAAAVIKAATIDGAQCLGLENTGLLEPGYSADIIGLSEDPLKNMNALQNPAMVMLRGKNITRR
jgi:imidazolonepropionase-like amidohydrolase